MASITANNAPPSAAQRPQIRVRPGTRADLPDLVRVYFDAFDPSILNRLMYPNGTTPSSIKCFVKDFYPETPEAASQAPCDLQSPHVEHIFMVVEEVTGTADQQSQEQTEIVALGKWNLVREPLPEEKWNDDKPATRESVGEGVDLVVFNDFIGGLQRLRRKNMRGDPRLHLEVLAVATSRQRLGAGSALLAWGNEFADQHGYTYWLEASPQGYPLYRRFGFEDVEAHDVDVGQYGGSTKAEDEDWGERSGVDTVGPLAKGHIRTMVMKRVPQRA